MLINLSQSKLFTQDPGQRFAKQYHVDLKLWKELWRRKNLLDYTLDDMCDYFELKTKRKIKKQSIMRWIFRAEVYLMTYPIMRKGVRVVQSEYFRQHEQAVLAEITKGVRFGASKTTRRVV